MPLQVAMPLKLRLDARAAREGRAHLDRAVRAAYGRAAATAAEALADRGDYLTLAPMPARFTWSGAARGRVDPADRAAAEAVIDRAIQESVLGAWTGPHQTRAPAPLQPGEGAWPEPGRGILGAYLAPSYDTRPPGAPTKPGIGTDEIVFVQSKASFAERYAAGVHGVFYHFTHAAALQAAFRSMLRSAIQQGIRPPNELIAGLYVGRVGAVDVMWICLCHYQGDPDTAVLHDRVPIGRINSFTIGDTSLESGGGSFAATGVGRMTRLSGGSDAEASLQARFSQEAEALVTAVITKRKLAKPVADQLLAMVREAVRTRVHQDFLGARKLNPGRALAHVLFTDGEGGEANGAAPDVFGTQQSIAIYPIVRAFYDPKPEEQEGEGEGSGTDGAGKAGEGGGPAEGAADASEAGGEGDAEGTEPPGGGSEAGDPAGTSARFVFPKGPSGAPVEIDLAPLNGELSFDDLGAIGVRLRGLMQRIAFRLSMPEGQYPGSFLVAAAQVWGARAANCSGFEGVRAAGLSAVMPAADTSPAAAFTGISAAGVAALTAPVLRRVSGGGSLGDVDFKPADSPVLQTLRHLGGTVPTMTAMSRLLWDAYQDPALAARLGGYFTGNGVSWHLHFLQAYSPAIKEAIAYGFKVACKSCLIQLCLSSRQEILLRLNKFDHYAPLVEGLLAQMVAPMAALQLLRQALMAWLNENRRSVSSTVAAGYADWRAARHALSSAFGGDRSTALLQQSKSSVGRAWVASSVELGLDDIPRVRDANGRLWTLEDLDQAIALSTGTAQAIDPLVRKIVDLPQAAALAKADPQMLRTYLKALLTEMLAGNTKITAEAEGPAEFAFRASKINEDLAHASVPGTSVALGGLHLLAHQAIGDSFQGDARYGEGLDFAFSAELGRQGLISFFEFTGTMFLSIVCPPLGAAAQAVVASVHLHQAQEKMEMLKGLFDEDKVMSLAEAELDLFMAELETVFAFIPLAGKALKWGAKGSATALRSGVRAGGRRVFEGLKAEIAEEIADQLKHGLIVAFMKEIATDRVMGQLIESAITPAIQALMHEIDLVAGQGTAPGTSTADEAIARTNMRRLLDEEGDSDKAKSEGAEIARKGSF